MSKAKDPAVLWYYRDYLSGTEEMSWAEQGAYARLLNKQADKGHLSMDAIKKILKKDFTVLWPGMSEKFLIDEQGNYYNDRMDIEVRKRAKNSQAQKDRIQKYWDDQRNNGGTTAVYSTEGTTELPIANANANSGESKEGVISETDVRHVGLVPKMVAEFKSYFPKYPEEIDKDFRACLSIANKIADQNGWKQYELLNGKEDEAVKVWGRAVAFAATDKWFRTRSITDLNNEWQRLMQSVSQQETPAKKTEQSVADQYRIAREKHNQ